MQLGLSHEAACPCGTWSAEYKIDALYRAANETGYGKKVGSSEEDMCSICLEDIDDKSGVWCPQCAQPFHVSCLRRTCNHPENPRRTCPACGQWSQMCEDIRSGDSNYIIRRLFEQSQDPALVNFSTEIGREIKKRLVEYKSEDKHTAIMVACTYDDEENALRMIKTLIQYEASGNRVREFINAQNTVGETALMLACKRNFLDVAKMLLSEGADVDLKTTTNRTLLMYACMAETDKCAQHLLEKGHDHSEAIQRSSHVNCADENGITALILACAKDLLDVTKKLLSNGADVDPKTTTKTTLLMYACMAETDKCAQHLLEKGHDHSEAIRNPKYLNCATLDGTTALMMACYYKHLETVAELLYAGARPDAKDNTLWTVLYYACDAREPDESSLLCVRTLLTFLKARDQLSAAIDSRDRFDRTALMAACSKNATNVVRELLLSGADADLEDVDGCTALIHACESRAPSTDCVAALMGHMTTKGIDTQMTETGETALMIACQGKNSDIVKALIGAKASVLVKSKKNKTALIYALEGWLSHPDEQEQHRKEMECVNALLENEESRKSLLDHRVEPSCYTALMLACLGSHSQIIKTLVNAEADVLLTDSRGKTALMHAGSKSHITNALLDCIKEEDAEACINARDHDGQTALMHAVMRNNYKSVMALLETDKINMAIRNTSDAHVVDVAIAQETPRPQITALLVNAGAGEDCDASRAVSLVVRSMRRSLSSNDKIAGAYFFLVLCTCWRRPPTPEIHKEYMQRLIGTVEPTYLAAVWLCECMVKILTRPRTRTTKVKLERLDELKRLVKLDRDLTVLQTDLVPHTDHVARILFVHRKQLSEIIREMHFESLPQDVRTLLIKARLDVDQASVPGMATV